MRDWREWVRDFSDPAVFAAERQVFAGTWHLLGPLSDIAEDGDWFTTTLAGRSVFVQRFRDEIVAFENICAHRFFPLRTEERGNGPIRCGFHGWTYNRRGEPLGVPLCEALFDQAPQDLNRTLRQVEIAICGGLIFGRLPAAEGIGLGAYLGATREPIRALTEAYPRKLGMFRQTIQANWKLAFHLTLDDYHIVSVHPDSFGADGPLREGRYRYYDLGAHSALFVDHAGLDEGAYRRFRAECTLGIVQTTAYRIIQVFPNVTVFLGMFGGVWLAGVADYQPIGPTETLCRMWLFARDDTTTDPAEADRSVAIVARVAEQDRIAAETLQQGTRQIWQQPALSRQEARIAWFDREYAAVMGR
jgi:phenylpropionate dioxygenase-like ring-hydroxylating dioxygenase large terminal subunit